MKSSNRLENLEMQYEQSDNIISIGMDREICHETRYVVNGQEEIRYLGGQIVHTAQDGRVLAMVAYPSHPGKMTFDEALILMDKMHEHSPEISPYQGKRPIIIGGCARTGTTLLLSILGAHPDVFAIGDETYAFSPLPIRPGNLMEVPEDKRLCEKTPKNCQSFEEIYNYFNGDVDLIHIIRDGREVCTSKHPNYSSYYVSPERWVQDTQAGLNCWHTYTIRYEDLVQDTEVTLKKLCEAIGLDFHSNLLQHQTHTNVKKNPAWATQARRIEDTSLAKSKELQHKKRCQEVMDYEPARKLLKKLNYA